MSAKSSITRQSEFVAEDAESSGFSSCSVGIFHKFRYLSVTLLVLGLVVSASTTQAKPPPAEGKPIPGQTPALTLLKQNCLRCHNEEKRKGDLLITNREALLKGGDIAPAVVPGKPDESFLIETLAEDADPHMPPKDQMKPDQIEALRKWITDGAPFDEKLWASIPETAPRADFKMGTLPKSYRPVLALALSPDGKKLAAGHGARIALFDLVTEKDSKQPTPNLTAFLDGHSDAVQSLAWSSDGKTLASGGFKKIVLWDLTSAKPRTTITQGLDGRITALTFTADGKTLVAADSLAHAPADILLINAASAKPDKRFRAHNDSIFDLAISPDQKLIASASADKLVKVWDLKTQKLNRTFEGHTGYALTAAFSPGSDRIATSGDDEVIKVWRLNNGKQISSFGSQTTGPITDLQWRIDEAKQKQKAEETDKEKKEAINTDRIFSINEEGRPRVFTDLVEHEGEQRSAGAREKAHDVSEEELTAMVITADQHLIAGSTSGKLLLWDNAGKVKANIEIPEALPKPEPPPAPEPAKKPETKEVAKQ
jgi:WD40 repeat protein